MSLLAIVMTAALAATGETAAEEIAVLAGAVELKEYDAAKRTVAALVRRLSDGAAALAAQPPPAAAEAKARKDESRQIIDAFERVVKNPRAPVDLLAEILGAVGKHPGDGEQLALRAVKLRHVEEAGAALAAALRSLGTLRDLKHVELFERHLGDDRPDVVNAAAASLGGYFGATEAVRKRIVASLVRGYTASGMVLDSKGTSGEKTRSLGDLDFRFAVRDAYRLALARLTGGVDFRSADEWEAWHREAKGQKWRDGVDRPAIAADRARTGPSPHPGGGGH